MKNTFTITRPIGITGVWDQDLFTQSLQKLEALPQPFMATLITLDSHTPFLLPDDLNTFPIPSSSPLSATQKSYVESVHETDAALGDFLNRLKQSSLYDHSLVVIFGDHGSYTGISDALGVESSDVDEMNHAQVPLFILVPGTDLHGEQTIPSSHVDVYPTVLNLLGLDAPKTILGQDLLNTKTPVAVYRKSNTDGASAIVGTDFIFTASDDGTFDGGQCVSAKTHADVSLESCRALYDQQSAMLRVSDTVIRGNMISALR